MATIKIVSTNYETWRVAPRWKGENLAVHAPVFAGNCERRPNQWVITHIETGYHAGGYFYGSLPKAIKLARLWDQRFADVTAENASQWPLRSQWRELIRNGRVEAPA